MDVDIQLYRSATRSMSIEFVEMLHVYDACLTKLLSKYGLYPGQPQVLFALRDSAGKLTQNELAQRLGISKASAGTSLRRLEAAGFVKRTRDKGDTRCMRVALTKKGDEYARWCEVDFEMLFTTMLEDFSPDERERAPKSIARMRMSLEQLNERLRN
ncbi:MAG: MarR family transcriptional regulator [Clostridia bacterium]|nr:MarR family transcriptional regulator [Clostridia bacterium]